jgi:hypothetical protein
VWATVTGAATASALAPDGAFAQAECVQCHAGRDPALVEQWRTGPHGDGADCVACHGQRHGALPAARADTVCTGCHGGAVAHSYATSKHGVLVRIGRPDWTLPLRRGSHRSPGCAYCHLHDREHGDGMDAGRRPGARETVCGGCHAPRFVAEQLEAGGRLTEIARLKREEAEGLAMRHPEGSAAVKSVLESVARHLANVRLGAGHQSPDYQWWHGQPALDGDLIRLRDALAQAVRGHPSDRATAGGAPSGGPEVRGGGASPGRRSGGTSP